jgi:NADH-quinone oxidoreductase subunit L
MRASLLAAIIILPFISGALILALGERRRVINQLLALGTSVVALVLSCALAGREMTLALPYFGFDWDMSFRLYHFSSFIVIASCAFAALIALYSTVFMKDRERSGQFFGYFTLTLGLVNGAVLADHLILLLFFWEGLLVTLFAMIAIGNPGGYKAATKAFIIVGLSDLCMMIGIALTSMLTQTMVISDVSLPSTGLGSVAFICLANGAASKAGSMPFHSWIPDAAVNAHLPFMAILPAALEKLLGIYFLASIALDMFALTPGSWLSTLLMVVGGATIILAVLMALIQKNYKRLLSFHAISQVGYMILGIGTAIPAGIVGGLFHMINHAMYKSCLFLTAGSVEHRAGTAELESLGGLRASMPVTFACFAVAAASISGVPPFNGFFSKELVYDAALQRGVAFYAVALLGSVLTAASFLKLGHAAFFGPRPEKLSGVREAPWQMLAPMVVIAALCVLFGVYNYLPLERFIQPIAGARILAGRSFSGYHVNMVLFLATIAALALAVINHLYGVKKGGSGLKASDHIHYAPGFSWTYRQAEARRLDPYTWGLYLNRAFARFAMAADQCVDWLYERAAVSISMRSGGMLRALQNGNYSYYLLWSLIGITAVVVYALI